MSYQDDVKRGYTAFEDFVEDLCVSLEDIHGKVENGLNDAKGYEELFNWIEDANDDLSRLVKDIKLDNF